METCIFCEIAAGKSPAHMVWEDDLHLAFLSIFPNTEGATVVIPRQHYGSYFAEVPEEVAQDLFAAARTVAKKIDAAFNDVGRTGLVCEGFGVNHLHMKLFPLHGTKSDEWKQHKSNEIKFFEVYEGYISSHDAARADDTSLASIAQKIRAAI